MGFLGGFGDASDRSRAILSKRTRLCSQSVGSLESLVAMNRAISQHRLHPIIDKTFAFSELRAGYEHLGSGRAIGKIVQDLSD